MFYKIIEKKKDAWISSSECPIKDIISYIERQGYMRDSQIEAIKTYLFLKIYGKNRPLKDLFIEGAFNNLSIDDLEVTESTRSFLKTNTAGMALLEYACLTDKDGKQVAPELEKSIKSNAQDIDYNKVFEDIFYGVNYTDYLYSLPMGAGKTFLMAAFIYLDLYFAINEPDNKVFAHNFMIFAPSGLKSSVVPSLKTIQRFEPSWIIPEPSASSLKKFVKFEVLDAPKTKAKSNQVNNPNAQKINRHQPLDSLMGLVAVTNAEKVILDRVQVEKDLLVHRSDDEKDKQANELRAFIGKIPNLAVYIDEVHHAVDEEIKLRKVVNQWMGQHNFNSVIGFSGTPYLEKAEPIFVTETLKFKNKELSNTVYYYPLIDGINNFLKVPRVEISSNEDCLTIVASGVNDFLANYGNKVYANGTTAKLAIYCGNIKNLEDNIYPKVVEIVSNYGLNPNEVILKYHKGNTVYSCPQESDTEFATLDSSLSKKKIVLLVQIGKEGWDCKSLTGVILSQKGDCPQNMVLQTSCRCLRQVVKGETESAIIWLNKFNAKKLDDQLKQQQHITLEEFRNSKKESPTTLLNRYSRIDYLNLPAIDFYQMRVKYNTLVVAANNNVQDRLESAVNEDTRCHHLIESRTLDGKTLDVKEEQELGADGINFSEWLALIAKESFDFMSISSLRQHERILKKIFEKITIDDNGIVLSSKYKQGEIRSNIRKAFYEKREIRYLEDIVPEEARFLRIESLDSPISTSQPEDYHPNADTVEKIVQADNNESHTIDEATQKAIDALLLAGQQEMAENLKQGNRQDIPERLHTYHYLPYHFDSNFERTFFLDVLALTVFKEKGLEIYFNGDRGLAEFKIECYKKQRSSWARIGKYTPDFLIVKRSEGKIHQAIIVETKGSGYEHSFEDRKAFMEQQFIKQNNYKYGYKKFDYLHIESSLCPEERNLKTIQAINNFFID